MKLLLSSRFVMQSSLVFLAVLLFSLENSVAGQQTFFEQDCLDSHNSFRFRHGIRALVWSDVIAVGARNWSAFLLQNGSLIHDPSHNFGENLATVKIIPAQPICSNASETSCLRCSQIVQEWYNEISNYNFSEGIPIDPNKPWQHFTQVVWRSSFELGVGVASGGDSHYIVARYNPRGNEADNYLREVAPPQPVHGGFSEWGAWSPCSETCGNGTQYRSRNCTNPPPQFGGRDCVGPWNETQMCLDRFCPVDGNLTEWGVWSPCSKTCENGTQIRVRNCTNPPPQYGGRDCVGTRNETQDCYAGPCPVDGNFTNWGPFGPCSSTCGQGIVVRYRNCTNPPPMHNGADCVGPRNDTLPCNSGPCPVPTTEPMTTVPETTTPAPSTAPPDTTTPPPTTTPRPTTPAPCGIVRRVPSPEDANNAFTFTFPNYTIQEWCSREAKFKQLLIEFVDAFCTSSGSCGGGPGQKEVFLLPGFPAVRSPLQIRFYVRLPTAGNDSVPLDRALLTNILESFVQNLTDTFGVQLAVDGGFTNWSPYGPCSSTCGQGFQVRYRNCTNPPPINNGSDCVGPRNETLPCNTGPCPVPTTEPMTTVPETTTPAPSTAPPDTTAPPQTTAPPATTPPSTAPPSTTPRPTTPPPCGIVRPVPSVEEENNAFTFTISNYTIQEWCSREVEFKQLLATFVDDFCRRTGSCFAPSEVFLLPGFPAVNSPLQIRFYIRLPTGGNDSVPLDRTLLTNILQSFLQNLTNTFGVQFAVDGGFTNWSPFGPCSSTCGQGFQVRYRNCTNPPPINNGSDCVGPRNETLPCNTGPCPGTTRPPPTTGITTTGPPCVFPTRRPPSTDEFNNSISIIIPNINIQQWCSVERRFKLQLALFVTDFCNKSAALCANVAITPSDEDLINILPGYPIQYNPVEVRLYVRVKTGINAHLVLDRDVLALIFDSFLRNVSDTLGIEIRVDGGFTDWGSFGPCSSTCGRGIKVRYRNCTNPPPINNGSDCVGPRSETLPCDTGPCPVDGNFTQWETWSSCSASCGIGSQARYRSCTNPPPSPGGRDCNGSRMERRDCQITPCPIDGNFTEWGVWSPCSKTCENGTQYRYRNCTNPPPQFGGRDCMGPRNDSQDCYAGPCPVDGNFTEWGAWGACSKTCGNGTEIRVRNCTNPSPAFGGRDCMGPRNESRPCYTGLCPVDGNFTQWTAWSQCSKTCGNGFQTRYRSCINPPPSNGGRDCVGPRNETQECIIEPCVPRLYAYGLQVNDTKLRSFNIYRYYCRRINIPDQGMPFFIRQHRKIYVCRNGLLRFISSNLIRWPERFPGVRNEDGFFRFRNSYIIAPYWAYINHNAFRVSGSRQSAVYYHVYDRNAISSDHDRNVFNRADSDIQTYQTNPRIPLFKANWILVVTWVKIYPNTFPAVLTANTFQAVLMTDGQHTFTLFNYPENGIEWSTPTGGRFRQFWQSARGLPVVGYNAGDRARLNYDNVPYSATVDVDMIDQRVGSANRVGVWFYRLDNNPVLDLPGKKCYTWYRQQANVRSPQLLPCPCQFDQAVNDKRFFVDYNRNVAIRSNRTVCAYSIPLLSSRWVQQCCYTESSGGGRMLALLPPEAGGPFLIGLAGFPGISDLQGHDYCCNSSLCALYYQRRPTRNCVGYTLRRRGLIWGDPHFATLDNTSFTFNGLGEYTMVAIENGLFEMQARTVKTSGRGLGTVFSAAAAKERDTAAVEGRINSNGELEVLVAGNQYNISTIEQMGTYIADANITLIRESDGSITALFPSGISFTFASVEKTLAIAFDGPEEFKNRTKGLLGTWNDDPSDDFLAPDGTLLPADATPQQIHYEFGLKWQIKPSESLFTYGAQEGPATFMDLSYVPMFIDNITWTNDSFRIQAEKICGNNINCLFDAAVTVDTSYGMTTRKLEENNNKINRDLANFPPQIHGPQVISATINQTIEVNITAEHNASEYFVFTVEDFPNVEIVSNTSQYLLVRWKPTSTQKVEPVFTVTDSKSSSSVLRPLVLLCPCKNGAKCIEDEDVNMQRDSGARFIVLSCACPLGLTGPSCEHYISACVESNEPCFPGVECTDLRSSANRTGYKCGPCPAGYSGDGAACDDIDECTDHVSKCSQLCINTPGSYLCDCNHGYKLNSDGISCSDIDECVVSNDCMQKCTNYPGGRNCSCYDEFQVDPTDNTACIPISQCNITKAGCQQVCREDHGQAKCSCHKGYELNADGRTCDDINECTTHKHKCSQLCHNLDGSYRCSCLPGYDLAPDRMTCNDIDECGLIDELYCAGSLELCFNTFGSFHCECQNGYKRVNNTCQEIFPTKEGPSSTSSPTSPVKTDELPAEGISNAVALTIRNSDLDEWQRGLSQAFKDVVTQIAVAYCERDERSNCYNAVVAKRSISGESLTGNVHILNHFPQERDSDLLVAFYVKLQSSQGDTYIMNQEALLRALKESVAAFSSLIRKQVYNIRAYHEDEQRPPPRESRIDESQTKWIIIGVCAAVSVVMVMVIVVLCRRHRRISCQLEKQSKKTEFVLRQWAGTPEETVFLGISNSTTTL